MPKERLELSIPEENCVLNAARMPIPPLRLLLRPNAFALGYVGINLPKKHISKVSAKLNTLSI